MKGVGHVPSAYMPPYRIKGYQTIPEPPKPPIIPEDLRKSIERRASQPPEQQEQLLTEEVIQSLKKDLKAIIDEHCCKNDAREDKRCDCKNAMTNPPRGISKAFWKLRHEHFGRPPSGSIFRSARFATEENQEPKLTFEFPLYESPSSYEPPQWRYKPEKVPFQLSELQKRVELQKWGVSLKNNLADIQRSREEWARRPDTEGFLPQDRVNYGCERIRELAEINANIVFLLVKKFVTGPPHKDLHFLNRTEAVDCWQRIVGQDKTVKECCVEVPTQSRSKPHIPSLKSPKKKVQEEEDSEKKVLKKSKSSNPTTPKGPKIPPFCEAIPSPSLRLPWHIPPLRPRDGDDQRKKFVFDRTIDLDFIIKAANDPYGEDRRKQRISRAKALRLAMTNDFFKRTDMDSHIGEMDMLLQHAQKHFDGSPKARRDLMLAQVLARNDFDNTADKAREQEAETQRQERRDARNVVADFSHVNSRYLETGKFKARGGVSRR